MNGFQRTWSAWARIGTGAWWRAKPWAASLPGASYEATLGNEEDGQENPRAEPVPLGNIVRYDRDRVHPESQPLETADVLKRIVEGNAAEVLDRALADLLGGSGV
jgi:hypothetical protein